MERSRPEGVPQSPRAMLRQMLTTCWPPAVAHAAPTPTPAEPAEGAHGNQNTRLCPPLLPVQHSLLTKLNIKPKGKKCYLKGPARSGQMDQLFGVWSHTPEGCIGEAADLCFSLTSMFLFLSLCVSPFLSL